MFFLFTTFFCIVFPYNVVLLNIHCWTLTSIYLKIFLLLCAVDGQFILVLLYSKFDMFFLLIFFCLPSHIQSSLYANSCIIRRSKNIYVFLCVDTFLSLKIVFLSFCWERIPNIYLNSYMISFYIHSKDLIYFYSELRVMVHFYVRKSWLDSKKNTYYPHYGRR